MIDSFFYFSRLTFVATIFQLELVLKPQHEKVILRPCYIVIALVIAKNTEFQSFTREENIFQDFF